MRCLCSIFIYQYYISHARDRIAHTRTHLQHKQHIGNAITNNNNARTHKYYANGLIWHRDWIRCTRIFVLVNFMHWNFNNITNMSKSNCLSDVFKLIFGTLSRAFCFSLIWDSLFLQDRSILTLIWNIFYLKKRNNCVNNCKSFGRAILTIGNTHFKLESIGSCNLWYL